MTTGDRARRGYGWLLALYTLVVAGLLIAQTIAIYRAGTAPGNIGPDGVYLRDVYSREIVETRFSAIALPVYGWLAAAAAGLILVRTPETAERAAARDALDRLDRALARLSPAARTTSREAQEALKRERRFHRAMRLLGAVCAALLAVYLATDSPFGSRELEEVMGRLLLRLLPLAAGLLLAALCGSAYLVRRAAEDLPAVQRLAAGGKRPPVRAVSPAGSAGIRAARLALAILGAGLVVWGVLNQGMRDVLVKAVNICTECVGLG